MSSICSGRLPEVAIVAGFCAIFFSLSLLFQRSACGTSDENIYVPAGYSYLKWHDYRINTEHPPFVKLVAALPLLFEKVWPNEIEPNREDLLDSDVVTSGQLLRLSWAIAVQYPNAQWNFAQQFLYGVRREAQIRTGAKNPLFVPATAELQQTDFYNNPPRLIAGARLVTFIFGLLLVLLVYLWSRSLHNSVLAGLLSLSLIAFDPNFIAHAGLVATDVPLAFFVAASIYFYWRLCRNFRVANLLLFIGSVSLAFVTKYSAVVLIPVFWLIAAGTVISDSPWPGGRILPSYLTRSRAGKGLLMMGIFIAAGISTWLVIWACYGFRYSVVADRQSVLRSEEAAVKTFGNLSPVEFRHAGEHPIEEEVRRAAAIHALLKEKSENEVTETMIKDRIASTPLGFSGKMILLASRYRLLPEGYLGGFATADVASLLRHSYLRGDYSGGGFRSYFLWTFLLKTPLVSLVLILAGILIAFQNKLAWTSTLAFFVIPVAVYFAFATASNMNIGHRHLLPIYPFLYVLSGNVLSKVARRWRALAVGLAAGVIGVCSSIVFYPARRPQVVFPHYLAYFNELAGGPLNGWRSLVDSNIDWGQDLPGLKRWLDRAGLQNPIYLCYFGTADPRYYQIIHRPVPKALGGYPATAVESTGQDQVQSFVAGLNPGDYIALSVHNLVGPHLNPETRQIWKEIVARSTVVDRIGYSIFILRVNDGS
jgi:hypothetical protein